MILWLIDSLSTGGWAAFAADAVAKATILLTLTAIVAACLRRSAAAARHRLWALTLAGLIVLPALSWSIPGWRLPILPSRATPALLVAGIATAGADIPGDEGFLHDLNPEPPALIQTPRPGLSNAAFGFSSWAFVWVLGFVAVVLPVLAGVVGNEWRRRKSQPVVDPSWMRVLDEISGRLLLRHPVQLRTIPAPLIPMTWGVFRPVVLLPEQAFLWPEPVRRLVLLHELAHVKRSDVGFQLIGRLATAVYWFHPLAWYALHRSRVECECACDDSVVQAGVPRLDYAQRLVELARALRAAKMTAAFSIVRANTLEKRVQALFDDRRSHRLLAKRSALALLAGALALTCALALIHPVGSAARPSADPAPAQAAAPAAKKPSATKQVDSPPRNDTHPITVTGRALDQAGQPIAGARVYLASRAADYKRIGETKTDTEGRYEFHAVALPIKRADKVWGRDQGAFQVFGEAEGFGFAWRREKSYYPRPRPANIVQEPELRDPPGPYEANDKIELDLTFAPAARLSGTIVDDAGNPLPGVRLEIRSCESLKVVDNLVGSSLDTLNERDSAPPSMKLRTTDAQGRFEYTGLPRDCRFWIHLRAASFPSQSIFAATTDGPQPDQDGAHVFTGEIKVVLAKPVDVPIKMVFADTGAAAPKVAVQAALGLVSVLETTDAEGRATLRLPKGKYRMSNWPARGTPYLVTEGELVVGSTPRPEPIVATLRPAAVIEAVVVDAGSGKELPGVDLWQKAEPNGRRQPIVITSWEVATRIAWRESPRTDAQGKVRTLVEPGKRRVGAGLDAYPKGYEAVEPDGQEAECRAGETVRLKFTMRKRG